MSNGRLFGSIRAKIFAAFLAMSVLTAGLGAYCLVEIRAAGEVTTDDARADASSRSLRHAGAATLGALLLSAAITGWIGLRILRPLRHAASVADRVAAGEFDAPIPQGGDDETGTLLRSMHVMQANIRAAIGRERSFRLSAERRLIDALNGARQGIVLLDHDDRVVLANAQARGFFPRPAGSPIVGERFIDVFPRDAYVGDAELQLEDDRWIHVARSTTVDGDVVLFWSDVSELKQREMQLMRAKMQAESNSAAKSRFLETMSHELRTPLHAMIGFSEMLEQAPYGPLGHDEYEDWSREVLRGGKRLADVVDKVLLLTKVEGGDEALKFDVQDLGRLASSCVSAAQDEAADALVELCYEGPVEPVVVMIEGQKLRHALRDIISNAIKFNKPGGRVDVRLTTDPFNLARLDIIDTGIGMTSDGIATARQPFGQVDASLSRSFEGVGLGLPLAEALIKLHGGRLDIESEYGVGTTVSVILPVASRGVGDDPKRRLSS